MKKETKEKIANCTLSTLKIIVPTIAIFWLGGMVIEMLWDLQTKVFSFFMTYGQISLTLFGFTFIGAIFEKNKVKSKTVKNIFHLSILFLSSAISFFFLHSIVRLGFDNGLLNFLLSGAIFVSMLVGFYGFVYGIWLLLGVLIQHWKEMD
ncbi:hypothetical protein HQ529_04220 [Candidatus Woesearchaeota archaeon]|nr:hypothetical protein [Candidatus Woesearchaeota archaeon]